MNELLIDLHTLWHELVPMLVAAVCGSVIGIEREMRGKPSGVKTTSLICFGCAAFASAGMSSSAAIGDPAGGGGQGVSGGVCVGEGAMMT